ncbi:DUF2177 family protein [Allitabrizicola rongguiensis]|uniref:DUF2177 family protein n=1 Tax=Alitabrizicola rongguiensis TaxID=2909234 RepID=UPI0029E8136B|nr:DUF2177 family protein [Tabrizicola rongguiensis]
MTQTRPFVPARNQFGLWLEGILVLGLVLIALVTARLRETFHPGIGLQRLLEAQSVCACTIFSKTARALAEQNRRRARMSLVRLYLVTLAVFLALDAAMLTYVMQPLFKRHIADLMAPNLQLVPAMLFYLLYPAGILALVSVTALRDGGSVLLTAAILGAMAYGTYELTSWTIMKGWSPTMVAVDMAWGTVLTAIAAAAGVAVERALA